MTLYFWVWCTVLCVVLCLSFSCCYITLHSFPGLMEKLPYILSVVLMLVYGLGFSCCVTFCVLTDCVVTNFSVILWLFFFFFGGGVDPLISCSLNNFQTNSVLCYNVKLPWTFFFFSVVWYSVHVVPLLSRLYRNLIFIPTWRFSNLILWHPPPPSLLPSPLKSTLTRTPTAMFFF